MQTVDILELSRLGPSYRHVTELLRVAVLLQPRKPGREAAPLVPQLLLNLAYRIAPCSLAEEAVGADTRSLGCKCLEVKCHQQGEGSW